MDILLNQLLVMLKDEKNILNDLIKLSHTQTNFLLEANSSIINNIVLQDIELKSSLDLIEKRREQIVVELATSLGLKSNDVTIAEIIKVIDSPIKMDLNTIKCEIQEQLSELKAVNDINQLLIQNHLYFVDYMMNTISGRQTQSTLYGSRGYALSDEKRNYFFDNKV